MRALVRAPLWLIALLLLAAIGVGVYAYFTTPLPLGLSSVIRTPGGESALTPTPLPITAPAGVRTPAGQPLVLGAATVYVSSVQRNQDLAANNRGGPPGMYTVVDIVVQNAGSSPLSPKATDFQLLDDRGRTYAVDLEATRSANTVARRRVLFDATVPPTASAETMLAFETSADAGALVLRVTAGYGELELPSTAEPAR
jgi:Domain of unknown function (DUF4352)